MANAVVELNQLQQQQENDPPPVDNNNELEAPLNFCFHFSIRGYVSEVRKRNPKLCDPFSSDEAHVDSTEPMVELPPMVVPRFRWWRCEGCLARPLGPALPGIDQQVQNADMAEAPMPLIGQPSQVVDPPRERNVEACSTSTDSNDNRKWDPPNICADRKGKGKAHAEDELAPPSECENGFQKGGIEVNRSSADDEALELRSNDNGIAGLPQENSQLDGIGSPNKEQHVISGTSADDVNDLDQEKTQASSGAQHAEGLANGMGTEGPTIAGGPPSGGDGKGRLIPLPDLNECNGDQPSDDDDNHQDFETGIDNNINSSDDDDDYLGAERRKTPKIRLLSELLGLKGSQNAAKVKKKTASNAVSNNSQGQMPLNENVKRKKASSQDEGSKSTEIIKGSNHGTKKLKTSDQSIQISTSHDDDVSEDESSDDMNISEALARKRSKSSLEKKNKKLKIDNGGSSAPSPPPSVSRQKMIIPKSSSHEKGKSSEKRVSASSSAQLSQRLLKKKGKMVLQAGNKEQTSLNPCKNHVPRECETTGKDEESMQKSNANAQNKPSDDGSVRKEVSHFPNGYLTVGNGQATSVTSAGDGFPFWVRRAEPMLGDGGGVGRKHMENRNIGEPSTGFRASVSADFTNGRVDGNRERIIDPKMGSKGKQLWVPEAEERGGAPVQQMNTQVAKPVLIQKDLATEVRRRIQDIDINSIPTDEKVPEQSSGDDIPMDIVELMAKNQYERNLDDHHQKDNNTPYPLPAAPPSYYPKQVRSNGSNTDAYRGGGESVPRFGQSHFLGGTHRPPFTGFDDVGGPTKQRFFGPFSNLNRNNFSLRGSHPHQQQQQQHNNHVRENQVSAPGGRSAFEQLYSYCASFGMNMAPQRYPPNYIQPMDSYHRFRPSSGPRLNSEAAAARVWPSVMASRLPMGITNPEMISSQSSIPLNNKGKFHHHHNNNNNQQNPSVINFNSAAANVGKNMNFSNPRQVGPSSSSSSVDLYSNEAIPALHLLSLMQNAAKMQSAAPQSMEGKVESHRRPSPILPDHYNHQQQQQQYNKHQQSSSVSSRQPLLENNSSFHPCYSVLPPHSAMGRNVGVISPIPLTSRGQRNIESSHFVGPPQGDVSRKRLDKGKGIMGNVPRPGPYGPGPGTRGEVRTNGLRDGELICKLNQNPSEFNDLKELRKYMISPEDLRPRGSKSRAKTGQVRRQEVRINKGGVPGSSDNKERDVQKKS